MALRRQRQSQKDPFRPMYLDLDHLLAEGEKYLVDGGPHRADIIAELAVAVSAQQDPYDGEPNVLQLEGGTRFLS